MPAMVYTCDMNKKLYILSAIIIALILGGYFITSKRGFETIKIGALYLLTGGLASYGEPSQKAAQIAIDDINSSGGIDGKKVELIVSDHQCDPKVAVSNFDKLNSVDGIHIFTSVACTGTVASIVPELQSKDSVLLGTVTSGNKLTGISPNFFRNWASDAQEAQLLSNYIQKNGYKNVAVIYEDTDYAKGLKLSMESDLKDVNVKISAESFVPGSTDMKTQLTKLQVLKPDALFVSVQTVTSGELVLTQMEQLKFRPATLLVNDNILKSSQLIKNHSSLEGAIGGDYVLSGGDALNVVLAKYKAKYGVDCPQINICAAEYDAIELLAQAIKTNGYSATGVKEYLASTTYNGVSGSISFGADGNRNGAQYSLFKIQAGQAVLVK